MILSDEGVELTLDEQNEILQHREAVCKDVASLLLGPITEHDRQHIFAHMLGCKKCAGLVASYFKHSPSTQAPLGDV